MIYSYLTFKFQGGRDLLVYTTLVSNGCQIATGNNFEKLATSYWPLVVMGGNHFLTYEK